jgi:hypothetical protein
MNYLTKNSDISSGDIRFFDAVEPPLKAGTYHLQAEQHILGVPNPDGTETPSYRSEQPVILKGTQFSLPESIIHARYPAGLAEGNFGASLPHLVLTDFALPWVRPIDPFQPEDNQQTPWLGLLTIYPDEFEQKVSALRSLPLAELLDPKESDVFGPALDTSGLGVALDTPVQVVDLDAATFQAIAPRLEELELLAHGRQVNTGGKVMLGMDADGYFSLLVGNRLPQAGVGGQVADNHIFAVSFEGYANYLRGGDTPPKAKIRLLVLTSWQFRATAAKSSFLADMKNLDRPGNGGVGLLQMPGELDSVTDPTARQALLIGYTALQNDFRVGEKATSWYRGPAVAAPTQRDLSYAPYLYSDHAMQYDPHTGIFDHSYSVAWQIGRLLALSDAHFAAMLYQWRNDYLNRLSRAAASQHIRRVSTAIADLATSDYRGALPYAVQRLLAARLTDTSRPWPAYTPRGRAATPSLSIAAGDNLATEVDPLIALLNKHR